MALPGADVARGRVVQVAFTSVRVRKPVKPVYLNGEVHFRLLSTLSVSLNCVSFTVHTNIPLFSNLTTFFNLINLLLRNVTLSSQ